jgi:hypothetical protein
MQQSKAASSSSAKRRLLPPGSLVSTLIRGTAGLLAFLFVAISCYFAIPFRAVHDLLKSRGLGNYLPTDVVQVSKLNYEYIWRFG